jgi:hypothetical protein
MERECDHWADLDPLAVAVELLYLFKDRHAKDNLFTQRMFKDSYQHWVCIDVIAD